MPELKFNVELGANSATGVIAFTYELEFVVEFRGSLQ